MINWDPETYKVKLQAEQAQFEESLKDDDRKL